MGNVNLNSIKRIFAQRAAEKCEKLVELYNQDHSQYNGEAIKQQINQLLIGESIRFSEHLISEQFEHISQKAKDIMSLDFGRDLMQIQQEKLKELEKVFHT